VEDRKLALRKVSSYYEYWAKGWLGLDKREGIPYRRLIGLYLHESIHWSEEINQLLFFKDNKNIKTTN